MLTVPALQESKSFCLLSCCIVNIRVKILKYEYELLISSFYSIFSCIIFIPLHKKTAQILSMFRCTLCPSVVTHTSFSFYLSSFEDF